jgi:hypothetical protein
VDCANFLSKEYFELLHLVADFDQRLLTIKGWGVTFSLATLVLGFQKKHWGLFAVAALSSLSFWTLEGAIKGHQMRYYPRMQEIEVACVAELGGPRIDTSWVEAISSSGKIKEQVMTVTSGPRLGRQYWLRWFLPAVMFPHVLTFLAGFALAWLSYSGRLAEETDGPS